MEKISVICIVLLTAFMASGCAGPNGGNPDRINSTETGQENGWENFTRYVYRLSGNSSDSTVHTTQRVAEERLDQAGITAQVRTEEINGTEKLLVDTRSRNQSRIENLLKAREFKALFNYTTSGNALKIGENHSVTVNENSVTVSGKEIRVDETREVEDTTVKLERIEDGEAHLLVKAYGSESVLNVPESTLSIRKTQGEYTFSFSVGLSQEAAERVKAISQNFQDVQDEGKQYLGHENGEKARFYYYVDGEIRNSLTVSSFFKRQLVRRPSITGGGETEEKTREEASNLKAALKSGQIPVELELIEVKQIGK